MLPIASARFVPVLLSVALASALPTAPSARDVDAQDALGPWCDGLGPGVFDTNANITFAALNTMLSNANSTGAPLVLGSGGAISGAELFFLSTFASLPFNEFPIFSLKEGGLSATSADGAVAVSADVSSPGTRPAFVTTSPTPKPFQVYCGVASTDPAGGGTGFPFLAVDGDTDSFSLCRADDSPSAQTNVIYKAQQNATEYVFDSCYPVHIQIIEADL